MLRISAIICLSFLFVTPVRADARHPKITETIVVRRNAISDAGYEAFYADLPQFGEPYITDNGDIVIPRIQPKNPPSEPMKIGRKRKASNLMAKASARAWQRMLSGRRLNLLDRHP